MPILVSRPYERPIGHPAQELQAIPFEEPGPISPFSEKRLVQGGPSFILASIGLGDKDRSSGIGP